MNYILFDGESWKDLWPLTLTRPTGDILIGIDKIKDKWSSFLNAEISYFTADYLSSKYPMKLKEDNILINGSIIPNEELVKEIERLEEGVKLMKGEDLIALRVSDEQVTQAKNKYLEADDESIERHLRKIDVAKKISSYSAKQLNNPWDIFVLNGEIINQDYKRIVGSNSSSKPSSTNTLIGKDIFIGKNVKMEAVTLNATSGPIYIGDGAEIMEGSVIRGPFAMREKSTVKLSSKIYGPTTIGKECKVGGEVNNSVVFDYSNKGHDGFIGNAVIGSWCNLGADTNCSNLKNNYGKINIWSYKSEAFENSGLQFCGLIMGDHSKSGINTMFNTGTVVGVSSNIFGSNFPPKHIPSFCWGGDQDWQEFKIDKAEEVASRMMERRDQNFDRNDAHILEHIRTISSKQRSLLIK